MFPKFWKSLSNEDIQNVFITGCGGGFDFIHCLNIYKNLRDDLKKNVIIGSYSFGNTKAIKSAELVFKSDNAEVYLVSGDTISEDIHYFPEILLCQYLDQEYPETAPHKIYAYYARSFCIPVLRTFYESLCDKHSLHAIIAMDGGSDSLMVGDEQGLGDPIEDAVTIGAISSVSSLSVQFKCLIVIGLGADRFNDVSDASSLRAISELTILGGFLGAIAMEPTSDGFQFYKRGLDFMYAKQSFRSVLTGVIVCSVEGHYGSETVPQYMQSNGRVKSGDMFLWPLSGILWAFDIPTVASRSLVVNVLMHCSSPSLCEQAFDAMRSTTAIRGVEELPRHVDFSVVHKLERDRYVSEIPRMADPSREGTQRAGAIGGRENSDREGCVIC